MHGARFLSVGFARPLGLFAAILTFSLLAVGRTRHDAALDFKLTEFSLLTYNVAGLPALFSAADPESAMPVIGTLLNLYDVALVQEDFVYHAALSDAALHPYRTKPLLPGSKVGLGDGLNAFSRKPFTGHTRVAWRSCSGHFTDGSDCLTAKGYTLAEYHLGPGLAVDVYNVHMDSGSSASDFRARAEQTEQLIDAIVERSAGKAVIVAGDTNMGVSDEGLLMMLLDRTGLSDSCRRLACPSSQTVDRVLFRGTKTLELRVVRHELDTRFVTEDGLNLSDHKPVGVVFRYRRRSST